MGIGGFELILFLLVSFFGGVILTIVALTTRKQ